MTAAAAATLLTASLSTNAGAVTLGNAAGLRAAIEDVAVTDKVHCRWGWPHHRWRFGHPTWDGCFRSGFVVGPRFGFLHFRGHHFRSHFAHRRHFGFGGHFRGRHWH
jgi:hypothetical protein